MTMRLCIPTLDEGGLRAVLSDKFGSAPFFTLVDTETRKVEVVSNRDRVHESENCNPLSSLEAEKIDLVVCRGLGRRAVSRLSKAGIPFFITWKADVSAILDAHWAGRLGRMSSKAKRHPDNDGSALMD